MNTIHEGAMTTATLTRVIDGAPLHLRPILTAVRDERVGFMFVPQGFQSFRIPKRADRPTIVVVGDDFDAAQGPDGFHGPSVRRIIRSCAFFAIVSSAPTSDIYGTIAATTAKTRKSGLIIETRLEQEFQWVALVQKLAPGRPILLATVKGGHA